MSVVPPGRSRHVSPAPEPVTFSDSALLPASYVHCCDSSPGSQSHSPTRFPGAVLPPVFGRILLSFQAKNGVNRNISPHYQSETPRSSAEIPRLSRHFVGSAANWMVPFAGSMIHCWLSKPCSRQAGAHFLHFIPKFPLIYITKWVLYNENRCIKLIGSPAASDQRTHFSILGLFYIQKLFHGNRWIWEWFWLQRAM